jgi:hypothetical protein
MKNWEYTVLSLVKTRAGLFLLEELDLDKSYGVCEQFRRFIERLKRIEKETLNNSQLFAKNTNHIPFRNITLYLTQNSIKPESICNNTLSNIPKIGSSEMIHNPTRLNKICIRIGYIMSPLRKTSQSHVGKCPTGWQFSG